MTGNGLCGESDPMTGAVCTDPLQHGNQFHHDKSDPGCVILWPSKEPRRDAEVTPGA